jgi:hypothetical protein
MPPTNAFQNTSWLSMKGVRRLVNLLVLDQFFNHDNNEDFEKEFPVGATVRVPLPQQPGIRRGLTYTPEAIDLKETTITVDQVFGSDFELNDIEYALNVVRGRDKFERDYLDPRTAKMAQEWDSTSARYAAIHSSQFVGVLGTTPTTFASTSGIARQKLIEAACPPGMKRGMIVPPSVMTALVSGNASNFNPTDDISDAFREGAYGYQGGFKWYESMSLYLHTAGNWQGAVTVATTMTDGSNTLVVTCTSGDTFKAGDKFSVAGTYPVNVMTKQQTSSSPKTFGVIADVTATSTTATLQIAPTTGVYGPSSLYQNVTALPTAGQALTLFPGTANPNGKQGYIGLALHPWAFASVGVKLQMPKATEPESTQSRDPKTGKAFRYVKQFDPILSKMVNRFDTLGGYGDLLSDNCCVAVLCGV